MESNVRCRSLSDATMIKIVTASSLHCKDKIFPGQNISNLSVVYFGAVQILRFPQGFFENPFLNLLL